MFSLPSSTLPFTLFLSALHFHKYCKTHFTIGKQGASHNIIKNIHINHRDVPIPKFQPIPIPGYIVCSTIFLPTIRVTPDIRKVSGYPAIRPVFQVSGYPAG